jgi:hypothetical protein
MRIEDFLARHGLKADPFANAEEAQGDQVLLELLQNPQFRFGHPQWPKFLGDPPGAQTSIVFGFKGSGKTAMRLALDAAIDDYNRQAADNRVLVIEYDEFNNYLASWKAHIEHALARHRRFTDRLLGRPAPTASLARHWRLAHHADAILAEIARRLCHVIAGGIADLHLWPRHIRQDVLFLAAVYLPGRGNEYTQAIHDLRHKLFSKPLRLWDAALRVLAGLVTLGGYFAWRYAHAQGLARKFARRVQVIERDVRDRRRALRILPLSYLKNQPLTEDLLEPTDEASRYEMIDKAGGIARQAGYARIVVVIDKVDEPVMIQGDYERMSDFVKPLWNNKLLQTSGIQFKILLPAQLYRTVRKAGSDLLNAARLDKANVIYPLTWSGENLYEILSARAAACRQNHEDLDFDLRSFFDPDISREELVASIGKTRIPRYAAKFMNRAMAETCLATLTQNLGEKAPAIPRSIFYRMAAEIEAEMRNDTQDLLEV